VSTVQDGVVRTRRGLLNGADDHPVKPFQRQPVAGVGALPKAPHAKGGAVARSPLEIPLRRRVRWTVECGRPTTPAIRRGPQPVWRRASQMRSWSAAESMRGERRGRLERS
jgi:hypothetical protein